MSNFEVFQSQMVFFFLAEEELSCLSNDRFMYVKEKEYKSVEKIQPVFSQKRQKKTN